MTDHDEEIVSNYVEVFFSFKKDSMMILLVSCTEKKQRLARLCRPFSECLLQLRTPKPSTFGTAHC